MKDSLICFAHSVIGASHIKGGKPCQDYSLAMPVDPESDEAYRFVAVADGHGSEQYFRSDVGSRLAVQSARECMTDPELIKKLCAGGTEKEMASQILWLKKSVIAKWNESVSEHILENPFGEEELDALPERYAERHRRMEKAESAYGTTLIAVLLAEAFLLAVQIGDGSCVTMDTAGGFHMPVPPDEKCFLNATTSICDSDAIEIFRHHYTKEPPAAVIVASDGIDDSFGFNEPSSSPEALYGFYRKVMDQFAEKRTENQGCAALDGAIRELKDYLPRLSEKGSGDDVSIGIIADLELLPPPAIGPETSAAAEPATDEPPGARFSASV